MTVSSETKRSPNYVCNGSVTNFSVPFYILDEDHIAVYHLVAATGVQTLLTKTTDYTVNNVGVPAGSDIDTVVTYSSGIEIVIIRAVPLSQLKDYTPNDTFPAESHEQGFDKLTMLIQQQQEELDRSFRVPEASIISTPILPSLINNAGKILMVNPTEDNFSWYDITGVDPFDPYKYYVNATAPDQGVSTSRSIKALLDEIGASKKATIVLTNNSGGVTTTYTLSTDITIPANIKLVIENGAILNGIGTMTIAGSFKHPRSPCFGVSITIKFSGNALQQYVFPEWWGENTTPGTTNMTGEFRSAVTSIESDLAGGTVYVGHGRYLITSTISMDRSTDSSKGRVSFKGMGTYNTRVDYTGSGALFLIKNHHTDAGQNISKQIVEDMTIWGDLTAGTSGITVELGAYPTFKNLMVLAFNYGMVLHDTDQAYFERLWFQGNTKALYSAMAAPPGAASTHPNNLTFMDCHFSENREYGSYFVGHSNVNFYGGAFENNGLTTPGFGIKVENAGQQGDVGINCNGVYFEGNKGQADVIIVKDDGVPRTLTHSFIACGFKRLDVADFTTNNIYADLADPTTDGLQIVSLINCGFSGYNTYVPSAGRPYVNFVNGITQDNFVTVASVFESALEAPPTNIRWKTVALDAGAGSGAGSPYQITTKEIPAIYQLDIDSLTTSHWLDLPAASTCIGYELIIYLTNSHATFSVIIDPDGTDQIIGTSAAGDYIHSKTIDSFVHLIALASGKWGFLNVDGAAALPTGWTEE